MEYSIKIGGEAGQGIQTIGGTLAKVFSRKGFFVFSHQDYESRVRGGHNFYQIRFSNVPVSASRDQIDILVALNKSSIIRHEKELSENGLIVYDSSMLKETHESPRFLDIPFDGLAVKHGSNKIMANTVATGAVLGMLGMDLDVLISIINATFHKKGKEIIEGNVNAAKAGHEYAKDRCKQCGFVVPPDQERKQMLINGVEAVGLGALSAGCKFYSAYPMTPSTGIMNYIASKEKEYGVIVEQAEDEISAINMILGASFAGVRAMTGTSGGGFALMAEGLSLAAITETPVVIALAQRPGPATGLPTRTEQGDLMFALHTSHGEFPRVILAPGTPEQAFYLTNRAFNIAEKYQVPVIILTDQYLGDSQWTCQEFDMTKIHYHDYRMREGVLGKVSGYKRHAITDNGVSPLGVPGDSKNLVVTDSDEHDEEGHIIEDAETRVRMVEKRLFRKMPLLRQEMESPVFYGDEKPDIVVVGWGSTYGIMKESIDVLSGNRSIAMLHFSELYPLPSHEKMNYQKIMHDAKLVVSVENNATGQFSRLVKAETGIDFFNAGIHKFDGRPFTVDSLKGEIHAHAAGL
jgi:2-oxoglutarate ferredoxin oxidoreductase subunit alpha